MEDTRNFVRMMAVQEGRNVSTINDIGVTGLNVSDSVARVMFSPDHWLCFYIGPQGSMKLRSLELV